MKKKLITCLTALTILASCGGSNSSSNNGNTLTPWWTTTGALEKDGSGNIVFDEVTLSLATVVAGEDVSALSEIISNFNVEYRGKINVTVENIGQDSFERTISDRVTQNSNPPTIIMSHQKGHKTFVQNKIIQPLNEAVELGDVDYSPSDIVSNLADSSNLGYEGYMFNVPIDAQSIVLYYNKPLLSKYNGGKLPETRAELIEVSKRAKAGEGSGFTPLAVPNDNVFFNWYFVRTALVQNGFKFFDEETFKVDWSEGDNLQALIDSVDSVNELFYGANAISTINQSTATAVNDFTNDRSLFFAYLPWNSASLFAKYGSDHGGKSIAEVQESYIGGASLSGMFQDDINDINAYKIYGDSHAFALTNSVNDITTKVAAAEFINYFTKNVSLGIKWANAGHVSTSHTILNDNRYKSDPYVSNYINQFYTDLNEFVSAGNTPFYSATFSELDAMIAKNIKNGATAAEITEAAKASVSSVNMLIEWGE